MLPVVKLRSNGRPADTCQSISTTASWVCGKAGMGEDFKNLSATYPDYEIWVTGHSLGAAMASLASSYIITHNGVPSSRVKLVTYGQPRVGDLDYARVHNSEVTYSFRVVHWRDLVPHVPPLGFLGYYHHQSEAFYPLNMSINAKYRVCYAGESFRCSDGLLFTSSIQDHLHYFNVDVSAYGIYGCNRTMVPEKNITTSTAVPTNYTDVTTPEIELTTRKSIFNHIYGKIRGLLTRSN
ncbi:triacylglycerol lipase [Cooperia oncophora]